MGKQFPKTDEEVWQYIEEEWERLQVDDFKKYIDQIHERCEAVILANECHTKWWIVHRNCTELHRVHIPPIAHSFWQGGRLRH